MSIGDYIHYTKAGYNKHGITEKDSSSSAMEAYATQRAQCLNRIKSNLNKQIYVDVENFLNSMMYGSKSDNGEKYDKEVVEELQKRVEEAFNEKFPQFGLNFNQGITVYHKNKSYVRSDKQKISKNELNRYLLTLKEMVDKKILLTDAGNESIDDIIAVKNQLEQYINSHASSPRETIDLSSDMMGKDLMGEISRVLKYQSLPYLQAVGTVFEQWLAIASQYVDKKSDFEVNKIIDKFVQGSSRSNVTISKDKFSEKYVDLAAILNQSGSGGKWIPIDETNSYQFSSPTQDKLDVIFQWKGDQLNVSAKNYKFAYSDKIHILGGSSLLYLINNENTDFVNHWLNCVAQSPDSSALSKSVLDEAHSVMKLSILAQSLAGNKGQMADTFILNDRKNSRIYVRSLGEIAENIVGAGMQGLEIKDYPYTIPNKWEGSLEIKDPTLARVRITNLLANIHQRKISASIDAGAVRK